LWALALLLGLLFGGVAHADDPAPAPDPYADIPCGLSFGPLPHKPWPVLRFKPCPPPPAAPQP
jgi:hypothetical protein